MRSLPTIVAPGDDPFAREAFRDLARFEGLKAALLLMPRTLRASLGMAVARQPPDVWAQGVAVPVALLDPALVAQSARGGAVAMLLDTMRRTSGLMEAAGRAADLLRTSLATHVGPDGSLAQGLLMGLRPRRLENPDAWVHDSPVAEVTVRLGPGLVPSASASVEEGRLLADVHLSQGWLRQVYVRGICAEHLVLEVLESSDDERRLKVSACRWQDVPQPVLRTREAEMTLDESGAWHTRWLEA